MSDEGLLILHDGEHAAEVGVGRQHVERCENCRARLAAIAAESDHVRASIAFIPIPPLDVEVFRGLVAAERARRAARWWRRAVWQSAAAVTIATVATAAITVQRLMTNRSSPRQKAVPASAPVSVTGEAPQENRSGQTVSFAATGPDFALRFDSLPKAGVLTVIGTGTEISARVVSGAGTGGDAMVVLPGELRVQNATSSLASYELRLPAVVTRLRVVVAGRVAFDGAPPIVLRLHP